MKKNKALKGFTLVELVVVVAVFGLLIAAALNMVMPIKNISKMAYDSADQQSISEDLRIFMEQNLQYADRMAVYTNMTLSEDGTALSVQGQVNEFRKKYYFVSQPGLDKDGHAVMKNRKFPYDAMKNNDEVYVMQIDNTSSTVISNAISGAAPVSKIAATNADKLGTVTLRKFVNGTEDGASRREWALNADYYNDYVFNMNLATLTKDISTGSYSLEPFDSSYSATDAKILPSNFAMNIAMYKKSAIKGDLSHATLSETKVDRMVSFKLKNIVDDKANLYSETIEFVGGDNKITSSISPEFVGRYIWYDNTPTFAYSQRLGADVAEQSAIMSDDIYIIFTKVPDVAAVAH